MKEINIQYRQNNQSMRNKKSDKDIKAKKILHLVIAHQTSHSLGIKGQLRQFVLAISQLTKKDLHLYCGSSKSQLKNTLTIRINITTVNNLDKKANKELN